MSHQSSGSRGVPAAARVFGDLQAEDALSSGGVSALRRTGAIFLALLVFATTPLFFAAFAAGVIGDTPAAVAHGNSGPGGGDEDDDSSGPGSGGDDDDDSEATAKTDNTSASGHSTRGTTNDDDTVTKLGTDDTSNNAHSTRGTTNDNDTRTQGQTGEQTGQTRTRTGS